MIGGILWRLRGIMGWPFTVLFGLLQSAILWPIFGAWSLLYSLCIVFGEPSGWKAKYIWDNGDWYRTALMGVLIGGIGAIAVPIGVWIQRTLGEPNIKFLKNETEYKLPFWKEKKQVFNWIGMWHEFYFGEIFTLLNVLLVIGLYIYGFSI